MTLQQQTLGDRVLRVMASLQLTVIGLLILLVLTIWGTLYQVEHGLYEAQERFYMSWIFLAGGWLPLPGAQLVMVVLFLNLTASFLHLAGIGRLSWGFTLTHGGLVLMLLAGAVTFLFGERSQLTLAEGEASNQSVLNRRVQLASWRVMPGESLGPPQTIDLAAIRPAMPLSLSGIQIQVEEVYIHSTRSETDPSGTLEPLPMAKTGSANRPGLRLSCSTTDGTSQAVILHITDTQPVELKEADASIFLVLRRTPTPLPAEIRLIDFEKDVYPGSPMARNFSSRVSLTDGELEREIVISMNKPLRYRGFTFYQSSFQILPDGRMASTFAVVKNYGRLMPYVATFMTAFGMLIHFAGHLILHLRKPSSARGQLV
ncbi:MAG: hypothetical protein ACI9TH_000188 [Kiritimatiellia bacterium]